MKEMTDAEVIKALECCIAKTGKGCSKCPYHHFYEECRTKRNNDCIDLINRKDAKIAELEAEIERLKAEAECADGYADALVAKTKSEAYREFAERLKTYLLLNLSERISVVTADDIDKILKELTRNLHETYTESNE